MKRQENNSNIKGKEKHYIYGNSNIEEIANKYDGQATFVKVNVDEAEDAAVKYGISSIPNVLAFKDGKPAASNLGFVPAPVLENFVKNNL